MDSQMSAGEIMQRLCRLGIKHAGAGKPVVIGGDIYLAGQLTWITIAGEADRFLEGDQNALRHAATIASCRAEFDDSITIFAMNAALEDHGTDQSALKHGRLGRFAALMPDAGVKRQTVPHMSETEASLGQALLLAGVCWAAVRAVAVIVAHAGL